MSKPAPYPGDTQSKGWRFEINTEQIKKSDTWLRARTGYVRAHLLLLWTEAWEQSPCGSLPDDDELIALMLGMEPEEFATHKAVLMRGWWVADDGRLYHDVIVTRVQDMIDKRMSNVERARRSRESKAKSQADNATVTRDTQVTNSTVTREFDTKNQEPRTKNQDIALKASESISAVEALNDAAAARARSHLFTAAIRAAGHSPTRLSNDDPRLLRIISMGATVDLVESVAREAVGKGKGAPWVYATVEGRLNDARASPAQRHAPITLNRQEALEARNRAAVAAALAEGTES